MAKRRTAAVTGRDVAEAAGVSVSAVSRAFRAGGAVHGATRERILAVARELGYLSPSARNMLAARSGTVTLVAGDLSNPFYRWWPNAWRWRSARLTGV